MVLANSFLRTRQRLRRCLVFRYRSGVHGGSIASSLGTASDRTYSAALADVDGDGHLDIVVSNDAPDRKLVYLNDGKGRFIEAGTFGSPNWTTRYVTLADLNGDGYPDIVAANRGDYPGLVDGKPGKGPQVPTPSYVCLNNGKGHFPACRPLPTESATSIVAADFDGDGALDLFVPHRDDARVSCFGTTARGTSRARRRLGQLKPGFAWVRPAISTAKVVKPMFASPQVAEACLTTPRWLYGGTRGRYSTRLVDGAA